MIRSLRVWSAVMGAWYLVGLASFAVHHPGAQSRVVGNDQRVTTVPQHRTYFEQAGGWELTTTVLGTGALALILCAWLRWEWLRPVHWTMMILVYSFGIGYLVSAVQLHSAWSLGGFALAAAAGHILFAKLTTAAPIMDALGGRA